MVSVRGVLRQAGRFYENRLGDWQGDAQQHSANSQLNASDVAILSQRSDRETCGLLSLQIPVQSYDNVLTNCDAVD